jgi:hypothetical protein
VLGRYWLSWGIPETADTIEGMPFLKANYVESMATIVLLMTQDSKWKPWMELR